MQEELAGPSSDSVHAYVERGGHYLQFDEPDLVVQAIRDLVRRCSGRVELAWVAREQARTALPASWLPSARKR